MIRWRDLVPGNVLRYGAAVPDGHDDIDLVIGVELSYCSSATTMRVLLYSLDGDGTLGDVIVPSGMLVSNRWNVIV